VPSHSTHVARNHERQGWWRAAPFSTVEGREKNDIQLMGHWGLVVGTSEYREGRLKPSVISPSFLTTGYRPHSLLSSHV
jgi:hypothetical protein